MKKKRTSENVDKISFISHFNTKWVKPAAKKEYKIGKAFAAAVEIWQKLFFFNVGSLIAHFLCVRIVPSSMVFLLFDSFDSSVRIDFRSLHSFYFQHSHNLVHFHEFRSLFILCMCFFVIFTPFLCIPKFLLQWIHYYMILGGYYQFFRY